MVSGCAVLRFGAWGFMGLMAVVDLINLSNGEFLKVMGPIKGGLRQRYLWCQGRRPSLKEIHDWTGIIWNILRTYFSLLLYCNPKDFLKSSISIIGLRRLQQSCVFKPPPHSGCLYIA